MIKPTKEQYEAALSAIEAIGVNPWGLEMFATAKIVVEQSKEEGDSIDDCIAMNHTVAQECSRDDINEYWGELADDFIPMFKEST